MQYTSRVLSFFLLFSVFSSSFADNKPNQGERVAIITSVLSRYGKSIEPGLLDWLAQQMEDSNDSEIEAIVKVVATATPDKDIQPMICEAAIQGLKFARGEIKELNFNLPQVAQDTVSIEPYHIGEDEYRYPFFDDLFYQEDTLEVFQKIVHKLRRGLQLADPHCMILYGPSGTGKTSAGKAIANEAGYEFMAFVASDFITKFQGSGPGAIKNIFTQAKNLGKPVVVFIDELQALVSKNETMSKDYDNALTALWTQLDECKEKHSHIFTILACNEYKTLDIRLRNRVRLSLEIPLPDHEVRKKILQLAAQRFGREISDMLCAKYAGYWWTQGWSGRDLSTMVEDAVSDCDEIAIDESTLRYAYDKKITAISDGTETFKDTLEWCKKQGPQVAFNTVISAIVYQIVGKLSGQKSPFEQWAAMASSS